MTERPGGGSIGKCGKRSRGWGNTLQEREGVRELKKQAWAMFPVSKVGKDSYWSSRMEHWGGGQTRSEGGYLYSGIPWVAKIGGNPNHGGGGGQ